jgi:prepilin-type N-terminal cleavage/methylation domain-containing protein
MFRLQNKKIGKNGFTLIEALVAITILTMSIAGPMVTASDGLKNSTFARDQIVAFYIGQEGVEIIRSIRDGNALNNTPWLTGIAASCISGASGCGIDIRNKNFIDCATANACNIYYDANGLLAGGGKPRGIYSHVSGGTQTVYSRSIKIVSINGWESTIDVTVTWLSRGVTKKITVQSRLFNQYDNLGVVSMREVPTLACSAFDIPSV